jgi:hypothetical protein
MPSTTYEDDISPHVHAEGDAVCAVGLRQRQNLVILVGNTADRTTTTLVRLTMKTAGSYHLKTYNSMLGEWIDADERIPAERLQRGLSIDLERCGFAVLELEQET